MFKIKSSGQMSPVEMNFFKFPGGEWHFKLDPQLKPHRSHEIKITTDLSNSDEIMKMMLVADYYQDMEKVLELVYLPYARQDRKTSELEPFSLKTMTKMINSCGFDHVILHDPHSDVAPALIDNVLVKPRSIPLFATNHPGVSENYPADSIIISPDAGAMKQNFEIARRCDFEHVVATKKRCIKTGEITETQVHTDIDLEGKTLIIVDDIVDGGRTAIELAKVLRKHNPAKICLHSTVGIYSKGMDVLSEYIDEVTCQFKLGC